MTAPPAVPALTATDLAAFLGCPHTYTRRLAPAGAGRAAAGPLDEALRDWGVAHEASVAAALAWPRAPEFPGDFPRAHAATVALLRAGVPGLYQATLDLPPLRGKPDLLRRVARPSPAFGGWSYEPGDVKSLVRPRGEQIAQVVCYALMLEQVQGVRPEEGFIILRDRREERLRIADYDLAIEAVLAEMLAIRDGRTARPALHLFPGCARCDWRAACTADALAADDVSLVPGIPRPYGDALRAAGVATPAALATADAAGVAAASGLPRGWLEHALARALARVAGRPRRLIEAGGIAGGTAVVALTWLVDLLDPARPVVLGAFLARNASGQVRPPTVLLTPDAARAGREVRRFCRAVAALGATPEFAGAPLLTFGDALGDLVATAGEGDIAWAGRVRDAHAAALRTWAFPEHVEDPGGMVALLRAAPRSVPFLPFSSGESAPSALLYARYRQRADGVARAMLLARVSAHLAALIDLYDLLGGAA